MSDQKILETFPNPAPHRDYVIEHTHHEFTSVCPMTGHPDFADIIVRYVADKKCVELKSLKLYFHAYRNEGIFFEAATNKICDDLVPCWRPRSLTIIADWKARAASLPESREPRKETAAQTLGRSEPSKRRNSELKPTNGDGFPLLENRASSSEFRLERSVEFKTSA